MIIDKKTFGLTDDCSRIMNSIMVLDYFRTQMDIAKFAMSYAISNGVKPNSISGTSTIWNQGSFDPSGEMKQLMLLLFPDIEAPYRLVEYFINQGLRMLGEKMIAGGLDFSDIMRSRR
jgi:hypothetical protein